MRPIARERAVARTADARLGSRSSAQRYGVTASRPPVIAGSAMLSASNPHAVRAGLRALERGGNAVDAAIAAAAMLCVAEPINTGVGGDAFALVGSGATVAGLDAAGGAPAHVEAGGPVARRGPRSVTVPGAVGGWGALSERFGRLGLDGCLHDAIDAAELGLPLSPRSAALWAAEGLCPAGFGPRTPSAGDRVRLPALAAILRAIAEFGPQAIYRGEVARAIASASWLEEDDLARYAPRWVSPLRATYRGHEVLELPPPTQGVVALEALLLLETQEPTLVNTVAAVALALEDGAREVRDGADVSRLLSREHLDTRRAQRASAVPAIDAGTSHLCVVDCDGLAVSLIQSLFGSFGSGVLVAGTGILLQNRGACFATEGGVRPGQRPFHTIIPGMITDGAHATAVFGIVGGQLQAQAHVQLVSALVDDRLDPQAALDRPRFRIDGATVLLEDGLWDRAEELRDSGFAPVLSDDWTRFGSGQAIVIDGDVLIGGSDPRMDGYAAGW